MVFFFDEAHLLFKNASKSLNEKIEQVVKLIRSKGVSIFFVTQSPGDIPGAVMSQLGNKIEHGLHAYTPAEQRALNAAADAFRENPEFDTKELMQKLGTGEAVVSVLDEKGAPSMAEYAFILPPESRMGAITDEERRNAVDYSPLNNKYLWITRRSTINISQWWTMFRHTRSSRDVYRVRPRRQAPGPLPRLTGRYTATPRVYLPPSLRLRPRPMKASP